MGDEDVGFSSEGWEEIVAGSLELGGEFVRDFEFTDEAEVVAIALVGDVDFGTVFEAFEEFVFPDGFIEDGVVDEIVVMSSAGAEAGGDG